MEWNLGKLLDNFLICRVKKPWLCVEKEGYPLFPLFFNREDSQTTGLPFLLEYPAAGLDRPLVLMFKPGLDHPPPGTGEGLLDSDMAEFGVPENTRTYVSQVPDGRAERAADSYQGLARVERAGEAAGPGTGSSLACLARTR